jgi:hypothetical protein
MLSRCRTPAYASKGVTVCDEWQSFTGFEAWALANGYKPGLSPDRIKNSLGYSPDNVRFTDAVGQSRNRDFGLTERQVEAMKLIWFFTNHRRVAIARTLRVPDAQVGHVLQGRTWRGVGLDLPRPDLTGWSRSKAEADRVHAEGLIREWGYCS